MRVWPSEARCRSTSATPRALSKSTSAAVSAPRSSSPIATVGTSPGDLGPALGARADRGDDQPVDAAIDEPARELDLAGRVAVGVRDEDVPLGRAQLALHRGHQLLREEVREAADEHADRAGRAAPQRPRDRVGAEADLVRRLADARLGLGRDLQAAQRVADGRGGQARVLRKLLDRRALGALGHRCTFLCPSEREA